MARASSSGLGSSGAALSSVNAHAPCAAPSTTTCPRSLAETLFRASCASAKATCFAPRARARFPATAAARRTLLRVTSPGLPTPTSSTRSALPAPQYSSVVSSRLPVKSPLVMARATTPPVARSSSASEAGTPRPCARATARSGVSTWASGAVTTVLVSLDMPDYALGEGGGRDLDGVRQQACQVVRDAPRFEGALEPAHDGRRDVRPAELLEHHGSGKDHAAGIDLVQPRVLRCRAVRRFVHRVAVAHVAAGGEPEPADLRGGGVGEQVAVQIRRGDDGVLVRPEHELREHRIGNAILDDYPALVPLPRFGLGDGVRPESLACDFVSPLPEAALGELHDIALVDERHGAAPGKEGVRDRLGDEPLAAELGHRLDPDGASRADLGAEPLGEKADHRVGLRTAGPTLHARIHVFDVLAEDHDVELVRLAHRAGHAGEVAHGADAGVEVEQLAQGDIEGADAAAHGGGARALDGDAVLADGLEGCVGQPAAGLFERRLPGQDLEPFDPALPLRRLLDGRVEHAPRRAPDVRPGAVSFDEGDDGPAGHGPAPVLPHDALTHRAVLLGEFPAQPGGLDGAVYTARTGLRQPKHRTYN